MCTGKNETIKGYTIYTDLFFFLGLQREERKISTLEKTSAVRELFLFLLHSDTSERQPAYHTLTTSHKTLLPGAVGVSAMFKTWTKI